MIEATDFVSSDNVDDGDDAEIDEKEDAESVIEDCVAFNSD